MRAYETRFKSYKLFTRFFKELHDCHFYSRPVDPFKPRQEGTEAQQACAKNGQSKTGSASQAARGKASGKTRSEACSQTISEAISKTSSQSTHESS